MCSCGRSSSWNCSDVVASVLMLVIIPMHFARVSDGIGGALGPMIAFEMLLVGDAETLSL